MLRPSTFSAAFASVMFLTVQPVHADQKLGEVIGTIARSVLEQQQAQHEQALWAGVVENGSAAAYRQYLNTYPEGPNARRARAELGRLEEATAAETSAAQTEARLGLTRADRVAVQQRLAALDHYRAGIDGVFGAGTRRAIAEWQQSSQLTATGYLDGDQLRVLRSQPAPVLDATAPRAGSSASSAAQAELSLGLTRPQRVQIQRDLISLGYDPNGADGLFGAGTREALRAWQRNNGHNATGYVTAAQVRALQTSAEAQGAQAAERQAVAIDEDLLGFTQEERAEIQERLVRLGYLTSRADGVFSASTRSAIARWQGDNGLQESGYLTAEQVRTLREQARL